MDLESLEESEGYALYRAARVKKNAFFAGLYRSQSPSYAQYIDKTVGPYLTLPSFEFLPGWSGQKSN
jgi:hypothetical protein